jgi:hypothetical protein
MLLMERVSRPCLENRELVDPSQESIQFRLFLDGKLMFRIARQQIIQASLGRRGEESIRQCLQFVFVDTDQQFWIFIHHLSPAKAPPRFRMAGFYTPCHSPENENLRVDPTFATSHADTQSAGWLGLELLWTKPRGFKKRSNRGHPAVPTVPPPRG